MQYREPLGYYLRRFACDIKPPQNQMQFRSLSEGDPAENRVIFAVCFLRRTIPILAKILSSKSATLSSFQNPQIKNIPSATSIIVSNEKVVLILISSVLKYLYQ